jgi:hypothetical protein
VFVVVLFAERGTDERAVPLNEIIGHRDDCVSGTSRFCGKWFDFYPQSIGQFLGFSECRHQPFNLLAASPLPKANLSDFRHARQCIKNSPLPLGGLL